MSAPPVPANMSIGAPNWPKSMPLRENLLIEVDARIEAGKQLLRHAATDDLPRSICSGEFPVDGV